MIKNNLVSEYLMTNEYQSSSFNLDDTIEMYDTNATIKEASIFGFNNNSEIESIQHFINVATGKDSIDTDDEVSQLFSSFCRNDEYLNE